MFVPKRIGIGYTINFGNPCGISFMVLIVLVPIVIVGLLTLLACFVCFIKVGAWMFGRASRDCREERVGKQGGEKICPDTEGA